MKTNKIFILGPCAMESEKIFFESLTYLAKIMDGRRWFFKTSFDKMNRTSLHGARGLGLEHSLEIWKEAKKKYPQVQFLTDVHEVHQVEKLAGVIDCIQIPAFLCRQTDLIVECAKHFDKINIKKMQHLGPHNLIKSVDKIKETNPDCEAWLCDRGTPLGYDHLIVDFTIVDTLKKHYDRVLLDATHSVQRSRAVYGVQGDRELAKRYFLAADLFNYDGVFAEVHPDPECAISDGDCQIHLKDLPDLLWRSELIKSTLVRKK